MPFPNSRIRYQAKVLADYHMQRRKLRGRQSDGTSKAFA
jgi:hypothetical protein